MAPRTPENDGRGIKIALGGRNFYAMSLHICVFGFVAGVLLGQVFTGLNKLCGGGDEKTRKEKHFLLMCKQIFLGKLFESDFSTEEGDSINRDEGKLKVMPGALGQFKSYFNKVNIKHYFRRHLNLFKNF